MRERYVANLLLILTHVAISLMHKC